MADVFLVAWRKLDDLPDEPLAWLLGTARKLLANRRRGEERMTDHGDVIRITQGGARSAIVWHQSSSQASTVNGIPEALSVVDADTASVTVVVGPDRHAHTTGSYIVIYTHARRRAQLDSAGGRSPGPVTTARSARAR